MHETEPAFQILAACLLEKFMLSSPIHTILFYERAERVNEEALRWIKEDSKRPFFLFINYMDAHDPYVPPPPYDRLWYKGKPPSNLGGGQWLADVMNRMDDNGGGVEPEREYLLSQYDGGLAYLDAQIGIFLGRLKEMGIFDDSLIVITSDHGEFLAEHGLFHHPAVVYQQGLRIPLIIKPPAHSNEALKKYPPPVSLVNLFPLILHYAGVNRKELDAASLLESSTIFSEGHLAENFRAKARFGRDLYSLIENNFKLIYSSNHVYELYNLSLDPFERQNLFAKPLDSETRNLLSRMKAELSLQAEDIYVRRIIAPALPSKEQKDIRERLRALGYIQ
jgi:arylsulfatase A-like enzyme